MTNPYAPVRSAGPQKMSASLPEGRLQRLGASDQALVLLKLWWEKLPTRTKQEEVQGLAVQTDGQLGDWLQAIDDLFAASAAAVAAWVDRAEDPKRAAGIALILEETRPRRRANLVSKLELMLK